MKIEINVSDFYLCEDDNLESGLKDYIKKEVIRQIYASIDKKVEEHVTRRVKDEVEQKMSLYINKKITELVASEKIIKDSKEVLIEDYIKTVFQNSSGWNNPTDTIKKLAEQFGKELKARYDLQFASHVVAKLNEQGMLKDDVAKMLLPSK